MRLAPPATFVVVAAADPVCITDTEIALGRLPIAVGEGEAA